MIAEAIDTKVKRVVANIRNLPTPPIVFHQIQKVINDPNVNAVQIASILAEDPAMSVKVLRLTNSTFYGLAREVESVRQAVVVIGFEAIKNLVLSASVLDMFKGKNTDQEYQEKFWRHSLSTAFCSRILAGRLASRGMVDSDAAFSAGLLHDVGKLVISCFLEEEYDQYKKERRENTESPDFVIEENVLGYNHAQIGGFLGRQWKIPSKLINAITYHHHPQLSDSDSPIAFIVHLADYTSKKTFYDSYEQHLVGEVDPHVMEYMGLTAGDLEGYGDLLREEYLKAETFMQMAGIS